MKYFRVKEFETYQHYKDRNPPWIKLHRELLTSQTWVALDDASRVLAVACMLLAAATGNRIPLDRTYLKRVAYLNSEPVFQPLLDTQFIEIIEEPESMLADASKPYEMLDQRRGEKRRNNTMSTDVDDMPKFAHFWRTWPASKRKVAKATCLQRWRSKHLEQIGDQIIAHVEVMKGGEQWRSGFEPAPLTYLNQRRWEDGNTDDNWREDVI